MEKLRRRGSIFLLTRREIYYPQFEAEFLMFQLEPAKAHPKLTLKNNALEKTQGKGSRSWAF
jgi:hypothetical protein